MTSLEQYRRLLHQNEAALKILKKKALGILISRLLVTAAFILPVLLYREGEVIGTFFMGLGLIGVFLFLIKIKASSFFGLTTFIFSGMPGE